MFVVDLPSICTYNDAWDGTGAYSAVNAAFDMWLVAIPAFVVWRLQMKTERKVNVIAVFATGVLWVFSLRHAKVMMASTEIHILLEPVVLP